MQRDSQLCNNRFFEYAANFLYIKQYKGWEKEGIQTAGRAFEAYSLLKILILGIVR